ncbi:MAG: SPOR domain-containing protein [Bacteroidales bacterium]
MRLLLTILLTFTFEGALLPAHSLSGDYMPDSVPSSTASKNLPAVSTFPSELTAEGLISLAGGQYAIQMGAFSRRTNAESLVRRIEEMTGLALELVEEDGLYKVFINSSLRGQAPSIYVPVSFAGESGARAKPVSETEKVVTASVEEVGINQDSVTDTGEAVAASASTVHAEAESVPAELIIPASEMQGDPVSSSSIAGELSVAQPSKWQKFKNIFVLKGDSPWLARYNYFGKSVALVNALIITIIASFASMLILLLVILLNRRRMEREAKLRQYLLEQYQSLIIDYLFGNSGPDAFRKIASDDYRRQVLIDQMIDVSVNLKGDSREKLTKLYNDLELDRDSLARARSRRWHKKIKGFRELAFMGIREGNEEMINSLNSKNEILRMEAQIALVRLSDNDHFEFLSHLRRPFSLWEQITLHDLIIQHELPVPDFQRWLGSENPTVVMFALRMIREFKQKEAESEMKKVMLHRDPRVSKLAVEVAGDLDMRSSLDTMKRMYKFQEYNNCLEIVKSMGKMPDTSMLGFLKLVLDKEDDVQLQIEAVKAIENMGEVGVQALVKVMKSEYKNYNIIVRHVLDRRIY